MLHRNEHKKDYSPLAFRGLAFLSLHYPRHSSSQEGMSCENVLLPWEGNAHSRAPSSNKGETLSALLEDLKN